MTGISPQQKEGSSKKRKRKKGARIEMQEVKLHLKSSIFQKEKRNRG
jgi:hypothetical protein